MLLANAMKCHHIHSSIHHSMPISGRLSLSLCLSQSLSHTPLIPHPMVSNGGQYCFVSVRLCLGALSRLLLAASKQQRTSTLWSSAPVEMFLFQCHRTGGPIVPPESGPFSSGWPALVATQPRAYRRSRRAKWPEPIHC